MWTFKTFMLAVAGGAMVQARPHQRQASAQVIKSCTQPNVVALTFDDGPYVWTRTVADTLSAANAKGTFFVNGNNFDCIYNGQNPSNLKYAYDQGHQVASHTWSHPHLTSLPRSQIEGELTKINDAIQSITGAIPAFIRPPYGEYDQNVQSVAGSLGQTIVTWDFDSGDAAGATVDQSIESYRRLLSSHPDNALTLNHETHFTTATILLNDVIRMFQGGGYSLVTVAECLGMEPYVSVGQPSEPNSNWAC